MASIFHRPLPVFVGGRQPYTAPIHAAVASAPSAAIFDLAVSSDGFAVSALQLSQVDTVVASDSYTSNIKIFGDAIFSSDTYASISNQTGSPWAADFSSDFGPSSNVVLTNGFSDLIVSSDRFPLTPLSASLADSVASVSNPIIAGTQSNTTATLGDSLTTLEAISSSLGTFYNPFTSEFTAEFGGGTDSTTGAQTQTDILSTTDFYSATSNVVALTATIVDSLTASETSSSSLSTFYNPFTNEFTVEFGGGAASSPGAQTQTDALGSIDFYATTSTFIVALTDSIVTSTFYSNPNLVTIFDSASSVDTIDGASVGLNAAVVLADSATSLAISATVTFAVNAGLMDTTIAADSLAKTYLIAGLPPDTGITSDSFVFGGQGYVASLNDSLASSDGVAQVAFVNGLTDFAGLSDTLIASGYSGIQSPNDSILATDAISGILGNGLFGFADSSNNSDFYFYPLNANQIDLVDNTDSLTGLLTVVGFAVLADVVFSNELLIGSLGVSALSLADAATATDTMTLPVLGHPVGLADISIPVDSVHATFTPALLQNDTAATSETLSAGGFNLTSNIFDSVATTDLYYYITYVATIGDVVSSGDTFVVLATSAILSLTDLTIVSDRFSSFFSGQSLNDIGTTADSIIQLPFGTVLIVDATATDDGFTNLILRLSPFNDTVANTDTLAGTVFIAPVNLADTASTNDSYNSVIFLGNLVDPAVVSSDSLTVIAVTIATSSLNDGLSSNDVYGASSYALVLGDTILGAEALSVIPASLRFYADYAATSDLLTESGGVVGNLPDTTTLTEILFTNLASFNTFVLEPGTASRDSFVQTSAPIAVEFFADTLSNSDSVTLSGTGNGLADGLLGSDALSALSVTTSSAIPDSIITADLFVGNVNTAQTIGDFFNATDSLIVVGASLTIGDTISSADSWVALLQVPVVFAETAATSDGYGAIKSFPAALADILSDIDDLALQGFGYLLALNDTTRTDESLANAGVSSLTSVTATVVPTGGAVLLQFPGFYNLAVVATTLTIQRSIADSGDWVTIYQGPPVGVFIDVGDGLPAPLDGATPYVWRCFDNNGTITVGPLIASASLLNEPDQLSQLLIHALQGAIDTMVLPPGIQRPQVTTKMPMNGWQAMPFIVINLDLIQQTETAIGEDFANPLQNNVWTLFANASRTWRVTVISQDAEERDFYRDSLLGVFRILKATAFAPMGFDVSHTFSASSYSSAAEWEQMSPGFYGADLALEVNGIFPAAVLTNYPIILKVAANPTFDPNAFTVGVYP